MLDARRDADVYFQEAQRQGMRIRYAADTHQHNDYLSGICELPARGEVQLLAGARAGVRYPARAVHDGERVAMGEVEFEVLHTPGHTPEHIALLVYDRARGAEPALLLSGGALLVNDVARPDLLGGAEATARGARDLCHTLQEKILKLPDHVAVYPTHVAGSLCGGNIGSMLSTTIGYERRMNALLARLDHTEAFAAHIPGALNVGAGSSFSTWAGTVLPEGAQTLLVMDRPNDLWDLCWQLLRIGYELPRGWLAGGMLAWRTAGKALEILPQWSVHDLKRERERERRLLVLDVRQPAEWTRGHIPGALHISGGELPARLNEVPKDRPIAVVCGSGYRSSVAASLLKRHGWPEVANVLGGMGGWRRAGYDTVRE